MNELKEYDQAIMLLNEAVNKIDNNDLELADKYLELAKATINTIKNQRGDF